MSDNRNEDKTELLIHTVEDANYYEALYQIIQDAQAAGSVIQIVTIWPSKTTAENEKDRAKIMDCRPSGNCPK